MLEITQEQKDTLQALLVTGTVEELIKYIQTEMYEVDLKNKELGMIFEKISEVEQGIGKRWEVVDLIQIHPNFETKNGCTWARDNQNYLGQRYKIERIKSGGKTTSVKLNGVNKSRTEQARRISTEVKDTLKDDTCAILDIRSSKGMEYDHKNGRYDDRNNETLDTQKVEDFQILSKAANDAKRQHCKVCKETGKRYDAKRLGYSESFILGDATTPVCNGCYWFDPKAFNSVISKDFKKKK